MKMQALHEWNREQVVADEMLWKGAYGRQLEELRSVQWMMSTGLGHRPDIAYVIGTHRSKSITLPVVMFDRSDLGLVVVVRDNFYDWKLSVKSEQPIDDALFPYLFHTTPPVEPEYTGNPLSSVYFEGFPDEWVFDYHCKNQRTWSAQIGGICTLKHTLFLCLKALGAVRPLEWTTRAKHQASLEADAARSKSAP